jgi:DNA-directed RNA polymerase subunit beta
VPKPGIPESFKVLVKEMQSLALDIKVFNESNDELVIKDDDEEEKKPRSEMDDLFIDDLVVEPDEIGDMTLEDL